MCDDKMASELIEENKVVLLHVKDIYKPIRLVKRRKIKFDKISFVPDAAIGLPYGSEFEVARGNLILVKEEERRGEEGTISQLTEVAVVESAKDNRLIVDDGLSQKLSHEEIHQMKKDGMSGQEILESVVQGSSSFKDRTKFSQEKYVKKKYKRHSHVLSIIKPTTRLIAQYYYAKGPSKICHLRLDMLSQILTLGNVHAHSRIVVMETCQGLLTGAVLERLGGCGQVVQVFFGDKPVRDALDVFAHLSERERSVLLEYPLHRLGQLLTGEGGKEIELQLPPGAPLEDDTENNEGSSTRGEDIREEDDDEFEDEEEECGAAKKRRIEEEPAGPLPLAPTNEDEEKERRRRERELLYEGAAAVLNERNMDGLLIACRFYPEPILMSLINFIGPSRPVVVYSQFQEPLVRCYQKLKESESGTAFNIQLSETWLRHYQVLSGRTHPAVSMDGQSGYLLYFTTISNIN
ncbi:PREDICTED: tRNA (adenine(58)-N(1))-methyltransferase non-catalytic subunit TRM6-like isoform X1 [Amphimedon queenslandica]|uniref:tRNA (adenine(58)-N(1))-methyltransferase non-catalytic subunit TRM6 n=1 Tax=Amphimedon queenslandica TaxID=400682 RepID=A0AAN0J3L3_AMPQE|nr:PREDICTED: tRNA (adenine(58)-N(1))-methyltransferase non-catalytic subunit TRM6-like isoform X1 [Amphimedon queenslandica]|eukprot:XP_019851326.1 PREDICTED: tRNA (adenine(58)-N(1))-methyltransferase non-catalytic subunit TRM6-like isoform X1 [Amphimedon queenslandica]